MHVESKDDDIAFTPLYLDTLYDNDCSCCPHSLFHDPRHVSDNDVHDAGGHMLSSRISRLAPSSWWGLRRTASIIPVTAFTEQSERQGWFAAPFAPVHHFMCEANPTEIKGVNRLNNSDCTDHINANTVHLILNQACVDDRMDDLRQARQHAHK